MRDAVALLTLAVSGDAEEGRRQISRLLEEREAAELVTAVVSLSSVVTMRLARVGTLAHNAEIDPNLAAEIESMSDDELRGVAVEIVAEIGEGLAQFLG